MDKNKIVSAHQPAFLPWIGYFEKIALSQNFIVMDIAKFRKRAFMHRNKIEINKKPFILGLHLEKSADFMMCRDIFINPNYKDDLIKISTKIKNNYYKNEYFNDVELFCNECLENVSNNVNLVDLSLKQVKFLCKKFDIKVNFFLESDIIKIEHLEKKTPSERLLMHAKYFNANVYITGENSIDYLDKKLFFDAKIKNYVQKFNYDKLLQYQADEEPLSIVHQIALIGYEGIKKYLFQEVDKKKKEINEI